MKQHKLENVFFLQMKSEYLKYISHSDIENWLFSAIFKCDGF